MLETLLGLPEGWWWSVDKLPKDNRSSRGRGKKRIEFPFSVYVCNGELIGTERFASATVESMDVADALQRAVAQLHTKIAEIEARHD